MTRARFASSRRCARGLRRAVVSSSINCRDVLIAAGTEQHFEARIDGTVAEREGLARKPAADTFLAAARVLEAEPAQAAVFEDALAGVEAGRAGASAGSSAWTAPGRPRRSRPAAPTSSCATWTSC